MAFEGDIFDIMGPIMIGPSSSHTAGALRLGRMAALLLGEPVKEAKFFLHGSFYLTLTGHGTDLALVAGLMGFAQDDIRIRNSFAYAQEAGLNYSFEPIDIDGAHPNTVVVELSAASGAALSMQGCSVGGGNILVTRIDDFPVELTGTYPALIVLHEDRPGVVARVTQEIARNNINIAYMRVTRTEEAHACMIIECDGDIAPEVSGNVAALRGVVHVRKVERLASV